MDNIVSKEELEKLEQDILKQAPNVQPEDNIVEAKPTKKKDASGVAFVDNLPPKCTKKMIQDDIVKVCKELGKKPPTVRWFKSSKKAVLEEHLKKLVAELAEKATVGKLQEKKREQMLKDPSSSLEVRSLYNANFLACNLLEKVSVAVKDKTFDIALLEGWCEEISNNREQLCIIYAELLDKYGNQITQFVDPVAKLGIVMVTSAAAAVVKNVKKKKEGLKKK